MSETYNTIISWLGGRKCFLVTLYSVALEALLIIASVILAFLNKITPQWVTIFCTYSGYSATLIIGYVTGNVKEAITSIREIENGDGEK